MYYLSCCVVPIEMVAILDFEGGFCIRPPTYGFRECFLQTYKNVVSRFISSLTAQMLTAVCIYLKDFPKCVKPF